MGHTLTLDMSQDIYEPLVKTAQQTGHTPGELATERLAAAVRSACHTSGYTDPVVGG